MQKTKKLILIFYLTCCASTMRGEAFKVGMPSSFNSIDPIHISNIFDMFAMSLYCESLLRIDDDGGLRGSLVKRWSISEDGLLYTFFLRADALFHDGTAVTSDDVIYSFSRHYWRDSKSGVPNALRYSIGNIGRLDRGQYLTSISRVSDKVFKIQLKKRYIPFLEMLSQTSLCIVKAKNPQISAGPFAISSKTEKKIEFLKFKDYVGKDFEVDSLIIESFLDKESVAKYFFKGNFDLLVGNFSIEVSEELGAVEDFFELLTVNHFVFNPTKGHLSDLEFRKNLGMLLQHLAWKKNNIPKLQIPTQNIFPSGFFKYYKRSNNISIEEVKRRLKNRKGHFDKTLKFVFLERLYSKGFYNDLRKNLIELAIPFELNLVEVPEYLKVVQNNSFDVSNFPATPLFNDPDALFYGEEKRFDEKKYNPSFYLSPYRNISNKEVRMRGYIEGLSSYEDQWVMVPGYSVNMGVIRRSNIRIPKTKYRNVLELWNLKRKEDSL